MKHLALPSLLVFTLFGLALAGCGSKESTPTAESAGADHSEDSSHHDHSEDPGHESHGDNNAGKTDMEKMKATLAKMDPEDAASAEKQHTCPVSGEMLGTMGMPQKVTVDGHAVWVCCGSCKDKLLAEPDKYLAKLQHEH